MDTSAPLAPAPSSQAAQRPTGRPGAAARLDPDDRRAALGISTTEGAFATAHSALTGNGIGGNVFSTGFALLLGATNVHLGVLAALPQIATTGQVLSAYVLQRAESRRALVIASAAVARSLIFLAPALPFLLAREWALPAFIALFGLAAFTYQFAGNAWASWMGDLVPKPVRGRYFSRRSNICNLVGLLVGVAGALALDAYAGGRTGTSPEADARRLVGFIAVFSIGAILGNVSTVLLRFQAEPARPRRAHDEDALPLGAFIAIPFQDENFRRVLTFLAAFSFVNGLGNPFWVPFVLEDLHQSYKLITVLVLIGGLAGLLTLRLWGRALDRFGAKPVMTLAALISVTHPLYYLVATPTFILPIYADYISAGIVWGGYNLALFNLVLAFAPERRGREMYIAAHAAAVGLSLAMGSIVSGLLADTIGRQAIFATASALRLASLVLLARVREPRARPLGELLARARRTIFGV